MGYYIKKTEQTTPVQAVTESSLRSASEINVPTVKAVLDGLHYPNLLINGDFQINQRGQSDYTIQNSWQYTVDMWRMIGYGHLQLKSNCIRFYASGSTSIQFNQRITLNKSKYTCILKIVNIKGAFKLKVVGETTTETLITSTGIYSALHNNNITDITLESTTSQVEGDYIDIEYIDLFEGDIAYPHVKEDYEIALTRCVTNVLKGYGIGSRKFVYANGQVLFQCIFPCKFKTTPNVSVVSVKYTDTAGSLKTVNANNISVETSVFVFRADVSNIAISGGNVYVEYLATCEPL